MTTAEMTKTQKIEILRRMMTDYVFFIEHLWEDRGLDRVAPLGWVEKDIADFAAYGPKFRCVLAPRGLGKTHLVSAALAVYRLFQDPDHKVIIVSKSESEAKKTIALVKEWLRQVWFLQHLQPGKKQRSSATQIDVGPAKENRQPSLTAIGVDGQLEGNRAHTILPDDVETKSNTVSLDAREKLAERINEFQSILYPTNDDSPKETEVVAVGTYHHEESVYIKMHDRGYTVRTWTIACPDPEMKVLNLSPAIQEKIDSGDLKPGDPVMPYKFNEQNIIEKKAGGRTYFLMQHMLIANLGDTNRYPLVLSDLVVFDGMQVKQSPERVIWGTVNASGASTKREDIQILGFQGDHLHGPVMFDAKWSDYTGTRMGIDPAGRGLDKTGVAIVSHLNGNLFVQELVGLDGGTSPEAFAEIARLAKHYEVDEIAVEDNFGRGMWQQLFEPHLQRAFVRGGWACSVKSINAVGQKELRIIDTLEPIASTHRLIVHKRVVEPREDKLENEFQYQWTRITRDKGCLVEDGKLDALQIAVAEWQYALNQDPIVTAERKARDEFEEQMRMHREGLVEVHGRILPTGTNIPNRWVDRV